MSFSRISQEEYDQHIREIEDALEEERRRSGDLAKANHSQMNVFNTEDEQNLIKWQLDFGEDLDKLYHLLRGDIMIEHEDGSVEYKQPDDPDLIPFNEFGTQLIMNIIQFYTNRNTILSNYDSPTILWKVHDFGIEVSDLIHNRYEDMMLTIERDEDETDFEWSERMKDHLSKKLKLYPMIVRELVDSVHSSYNRAYNGGERESLRTARTVTQNEPLGGMRNGMPMSYPAMGSSQGRRFRFWNPTTWRGG